MEVGCPLSLYPLLLVCLLGLLVVSWQLSGHEALSPMVLNTLMFTVAAALCLVGLSSWNVVELQWDGFSIVLFGSVCFVGGCLLADRASARESHPKHVRSTRLWLPKLAESVPNWKFIVLFAIMLLAVVVRIKETVDLANASGKTFDSFMSMASYVRMNTMSSFSTDSIRFGEGFSIVERQLEKVVKVVGYVSVLLAVKALVDKTPRKLIWPVACLGISLLFVLLAGGRGSFAFTIVSGLFAYYFLSIYRGKKVRRVSKAIIKAAAVIALIGVPLFFLSSALIGRKASMGPVGYVSFYLGAGIPSLQHALDSGITSAQYLGMNTFYGVYTLLYKIGILRDIPAYASNFIYLEGHGSNIYTMYYRYFADFGCMGVVLLSALCGFIYTKLFSWVKRSRSLIAIACFMPIGCYLFDLEREEFLFSRGFTTNFVIQLVLLALCVLWLTWPKKEKGLGTKSPERHGLNASPAKTSADR
jgi:oligosaccharide repeat unit polymerase